MSHKEFKRLLDKEEIGYDFLSKIEPNPLINKLDQGEGILRATNEFRTCRNGFKKTQRLNDAYNSDEQFLGFLRSIVHRLRVPVVRHINSGNVFGFSMGFLKHLFIDDYLHKRIIHERCVYGIRLSKKDLPVLSLHFKSSLKQAIEYLVHSSQVDLAIAPVQLYYSLLNFMNCYNVMKYPDFLSDSRNKSHGLRIEKIDNQDIFNSRIRITKYGNIQTYLKLRGLTTQNDTLTVWDSIKSTHFLRPILSRRKIDSNVLEIIEDSEDGLSMKATGAFPSRLIFNMAHFSKLLGFSANEESNVAKIESFLLPDFQEFLRIGWVKIDETRMRQWNDGQWVGVIEFCPQYKYEKDLIEFFATHRDHNSNRFLIFDQVTGINDQIFHLYIISCFLGFLSRYHPHSWNKVITNETERILIETFVSSSAIFMLYRFLTLFCREHFVFK